MTAESKHIYLISIGTGINKYIPSYDESCSVPSRDDFYFLVLPHKYIDLKGKRFVFRFKHIKTAADEKKLRSYDVFATAPGHLLVVNNSIMDCLKHLIDKDIQVLPAEIYTCNGQVNGYHLVEVINTVHGVDKEHSTYSSYTGFLDKLVPKDEDFMEGHEIAREDEQKGNIYIIPKLREDILKTKKGKLKGIDIWTAKEYWEADHNIATCPY